jgi:hypothetical protein
MTNTFKHSWADLTILACVVGVLLVLAANRCASHAPATLSPEAQRAWYGTRVIKALDSVRDAAIDAQAQTPPLLSEAVTRRIVLMHRSLLETIHQAPSGWPAIVTTALDEVERGLPPAERAILDPYLALTRTWLKDVP